MAEPLNPQSWPFIDELNCAVQGAEWSGCTLLHVVTKATIDLDLDLDLDLDFDFDFDGGERDSFDPGSGYRDTCAAILGAN